MSLLRKPAPPDPRTPVEGAIEVILSRRSHAALVEPEKEHVHVVRLPAKRRERRATAHAHVLRAP